MASTSKILKIIIPIVVVMVGVIFIPRKKTTTDVPASIEVKDSIKKEMSVPIQQKEVIEEVEAEKKVETNMEKTTTDFVMNFRSQGYFASPLRGPLSLSGTFGELRGNHFHAGLDLRTGGHQGADVLAAADGYVSRIKISENGYGKALYIQHPNGTTTVYGHLQKFEGAIQSAIVNHQYRVESYQTEYFPRAGALKVKKGERIAISGNTGGSGGPHLHFEIRDRTGDTYNPLLYYISADDIIKPKFKGIHVYKLDKDVRQKTGTYPWYSLKKGENELKILEGEYGLGVSWVEYFTDQLNRLGVNYARIEINGKHKFSQEIEHFAFSEGRFINQHINYYQYKKNGSRFVKMFKDEGNLLRFYKGNGVMKVKAGQTYELRILLRDIAGNESERLFKITGTAEPGIAFTSAPNYGGKLCSKFKHNSLTSSNCTVSIPKGSLYNNSYLKISEQEGNATLASQMIRVHETTVPLHKRITVSIKPKPELASLINKMVVMEYDSKTRESSSKGGTANGRKVSARVKEFGIYYLALDTVPPKVTLTVTGRNIKASVADLTTDIASYRGLVDGKWILFEHEPKTHTMKAVIPKSIEEGEHKLQLNVKDEVGNTTVVERMLNL